MIKLINRHYYDMENFITLCEGGVPTNYYLGQNTTKGFVHVLMSCLSITEESIESDLASAEANTLWCRYVVPYHMKDIMVYKDNGTIDVATDPELRHWICKYCVIFNRTYSYYKTLIDKFNSEKDSLMDDIQQSTTTRFNDTPQNGGDFTSDSYTTNYTKSETTTPITTKMARLEEIRLGWDNLYRAWADEFRGLFVDSADMEE